MSKQTSLNFFDALPTLEKPRPKSTPKSEYDPVSAEREAQSILDRARTEAREILREANNLKEAVVAEARQEAEQIKATALEHGLKEGFDLAKQEVQAELAVEWRQRVNHLRSDVQLLIDSIAGQRQTLWEQTELEVVAFTLEMAKRIVKVEVEQNPKVIGETIRNGLRRIADTDNIRIRVSPDELESVRADRKDLMLVLDGTRQIEIVEDRRIGRGGCVIETTAGTIDARIDTQFEQMADKIGIVPLSGEIPE